MTMSSSQPVPEMTSANAGGSDAAADVQIPSKFVCPLTLELMTDPLMSKYGHHFNRNAILEWLGNGNTTCPLTRKPLMPSNLIPNGNLRLEIRSWQRQNGLEVTCQEKKPDHFESLLINLNDDHNQKKLKTAVLRVRNNVRISISGGGSRRSSSRSS